MVNVAAYTWKEFAEGTSTAVLYGTQLNYNFDYVSAIINKGITGANIATGGIDAGSLIAAAVVTQGNMNFNINGGARVVQIGHWDDYYGQMMVKGTSLITAANTTNTDITIYFTNGDVCNAGEPVFKTLLPHVDCKLYTTNTLAGCVNYRVATNCVTVNVHLGAATFATAHTLYWMAVGNV